MKFCELPAASLSKKTYRLGSIETFMRMVERGKGVTFIPELAVRQLCEEQRRLVKPFALPIPTREIVMAVTPDFIRQAIARFLRDYICSSIPQNMLKPQMTARIII